MFLVASPSEAYIYQLYDQVTTTPRKVIEEDLVAPEKRSQNAASQHLINSFIRKLAREIENTARATDRSPGKEMGYSQHQNLINLPSTPIHILLAAHHSKSPLPFPCAALLPLPYSLPSSLQLHESQILQPKREQRRVPHPGKVLGGVDAERLRPSFGKDRHGLSCVFDGAPVHEAELEAVEARLSD